jgi:rhodanese-related sulfurtransferase
MQQISAKDLSNWLADPTGPRPVLLDVREPWEFEICKLADAVLVPMSSIPARMQELDAEAETVVICHHGGRSMQVAAFLARNGFTRLYNLAGGMDAWAHTVDPAMATY